MFDFAMRIMIIVDEENGDLVSMLRNQTIIRNYWKQVNHNDCIIVVSKLNDSWSSHTSKRSLLLAWCYRYWPNCEVLHDNNLVNQFSNECWISSICELLSVENKISAHSAQSTVMTDQISIWSVTKETVWCFFSQLLQNS